MVYAAIVILAIFISISGSIVSGILYPDGPSHMGLTLLILVSYATISGTAVFLPYIAFKQQISAQIQQVMLSITSFVQLPFLFALFVNPESWAGGPLPLFVDRLPVLGILFDAVAMFFGTVGETGYSIFFTSGIAVGLFIEVAMVSLLLFWCGVIVTRDDRVK